MRNHITFSNMHSILEVPVLNERYLDKARATEADAVMLDLEDSATPDRKKEARDKAVTILTEPGAYGSRAVFVRINNLSSGWGLDDLAALAACRAEFTVCYPKVETMSELEQVIATLRRAKPQAGVYAMIETARAMSRLEAIAACDGLRGLHFGYVDYAADMGCDLFAEAGDNLHPAMDHARASIASAARSNGLFSTGGSMIPALRDLEMVERFVRHWKSFGYTACMALSPSHVEVVNRVFRPSEAVLDQARRTCVAFETATSTGAISAILDGKIVTLPDYRAALQLLSQAMPAETVEA